LFMLSYAVWPYGFEPAGAVSFAAWLVMVVMFMALIVYDLRWMLLPNRIVYPLVGLVTLQTIVVSLLDQSMQFAFDAVLGSVVLFGIFYLIFQLSKGKWIGGGDVKIALALGMLAGSPLKSVLLLFIASLLGSFVGVPLLLLQGGKSKRIPFGPFLIVATIFVYLWGQAIIDWYLGLLI